MADPDEPMPPLGSPNIHAAPAAVTAAAPRRSPVLDIRQDWNKCKKADKEAFKTDRHHVDRLLLWIESVKAENYCQDIFNSNRNTKCQCFHDAELTDETKEGVALELFRISVLDFEPRKMLFVFWIRYAQLLSRHPIISKTITFLLPGTATTLVCRNAVARLVGLGKTIWSELMHHLRDGTLPTHGLKGKASNRSNEFMNEILERFFSEISEFAAPRATLLVKQLLLTEGLGEDYPSRFFTDLRDEDVIDLPPYFTKRSMYKRLLLDLGYDVDVGHRKSTKRPTCGQEQTKKDYVPSWPTFLTYWDNNYPQMKIQHPREDICGQCYIFANTTKIKKKPIQEEEDEFDTSVESDKSVASAGSDVVNVDAAIMQQEQVILKAAKHVKMACIQREYYNEKKAEAKANPSEIKVYTIDYAQNVMMPHFGSEQPGETYYYSPVNCFVLGIVDCGKVPMTLNAHVYFEDEGSKGGNNVASLLRRQLFYDGFIQGGTYIKHVKEMNFVFDNCAGQNKNRMVLRMLPWLINQGCCDIARAIFLIRGHTKNDCDRMFNLLKKEYRERNSYTPQDVLTNMKHKQIKVIRAHPRYFCDWNTYQDKYMRPTKDVSKNHVFTCYKTDPENLHIQEHNGGASTVQKLVKPAFLNTDWSRICKPEMMKPPGMKDIKWKELFDKWKPLIPLEKRKEYRYYNEDPGKERRDNVKGNTKASKKARKERTATATVKQSVDVPLNSNTVSIPATATTATADEIEANSDPQNKYVI